MDQAMIKQLKGHFDYAAVEGVRQEVNVASDKVLLSRLLCTNKDALSGGWSAKARWIGGGHRDKHGFATVTSSPTAALLGHQVILFLAALLHWPLVLFDVTAAFLQGDELTRDVFLRVPWLPAAVQAWWRENLQCSGRMWSEPGK